MASDIKTLPCGCAMPPHVACAHGAMWGMGFGPQRRRVSAGFPCLSCTESFGSWEDRDRHEQEAHGLAPDEPKALLPKVRVTAARFEVRAGDFPPVEYKDLGAEATRDTEARSAWAQQQQPNVRAFLLRQAVQVAIANLKASEVSVLPTIQHVIRSLEDALNG